MNRRCRKCFFKKVCHKKPSYKAWLKTYTKKAVTAILVIALIDLQLSYVLAFMGQVQIADAMAAKLKAAGFDTYITTKSGTAVSASSAKKSTDQIAREVIQGLWGNGADRTNRLKAAGYDPSVIQNRVNQLFK